MGGRAGGGARGGGGGAYAGLNRAQKIAVNRALSNQQYQTGNISGWDRDSAAKDLLKHWPAMKASMPGASDMAVVNEHTKYFVNSKTGDFFYKPPRRVTNAVNKARKSK